MTQAAMDNDTMMAVTPEAMAAAIEAERGVIFAARSIANRDCGGSQTEMREAREAYMIDAFAKFEREVIARHQSGRTGAGEALFDYEPELAIGNPEPSLRSIVFSYYDAHYDAWRARELTEQYIAALSQSTAGEDGT